MDDGGGVARVLAHARGRAGQLAGGRLVCVDGPAGSGKTTLAASLAEVAAGTRVLHMDDMYEGWNGLGGDTGARLRAGVMEPLAQGRSGRYRRFDWELDRFAEEHEVPPCDLLVLEGVGSGDLALAPYRSTLVWVEAPDDLRIERGIARDRALYEREGIPWDDAAHRARWDAWVADERRFFARHRVRENADLHVDGLG